MRHDRSHLLVLLALLTASCGDSPKPSTTPKDTGSAAPPGKATVAPKEDAGGLDLEALQAKAEAAKKASNPTPDSAPPKAADSGPASAAPGPAKPGAPPAKGEGGGKEDAAAGDGPPAAPPPAALSDITDTEVLASWGTDEREALNEMTPAERAKEMAKKRLEIFKARGGVINTASGKMEDNAVDEKTGLRGPARPDVVKPEDAAPVDLQSILYDLASKDPETRARGVEAARNFPDKSVAARYVVKLLEDPDPDLRAIAASTLGSLKQPASIPALEKIVFSPSSKEKDEVRNMALKALKDIGGTDAVDALKKVVSESAEPGDRAAALGMLVELKEIGAVRSLLGDALGDLAPEVRQAAAVAVRTLDLRDYESQLIKLLKDFSDQVTIDAIRTLGATNARSAVGPLVKLIVKPSEESDDPEAIQNVANDALERITGVKQEYADTLTEEKRLAAIDAWRVWWKKNQDKFK